MAIKAGISIKKPDRKIQGAKKKLQKVRPTERPIKNIPGAIKSQSLSDIDSIFGIFLLNFK